MLRVGGGRKKFEVEKNAAPFAAQVIQREGARNLYSRRPENGVTDLVSHSVVV